MSTLVHGSEPTVKTDVLSTRQVAHLLGVGEATVKRWADAGEIDCFRTPGGHRKFRLRDLTAFVQARKYDADLPADAEEPGDGAIDRFESAALRGDTSTLVAQPASMRLGGHELAERFDEAV